MKLAILPALLASILLFPVMADAQDTSSLAARITKLRNEVEELAADIEAEKEETRAQLRSYAAQKAELEMELQREEMKLKQLREARTKRIQEVNQDEERDVLMKPVFSESIENIKKEMEAGLPFKTPQRMAELDKLKKQMDDNVIKTANAVARLWDRMEDEFRLARENGIYRQVIRIQREEILVDVARVGMVMLYFKTRDGRYGRAVKKGDSWSYELVATKDERKQIANLFDSFKKQIRTGFFVIPNALHGKAVQ